MSFIETPRFPDDISYGSAGGPGYNTTITVTSGGHEKRNVNWSLPRHEYNAAFGVRTKTQLSTLIAYFHSMAGMGHAFRFKDHSDYSSAAVMGTAITNTDQVIGAGDGADLTFQLVKIYTTGALSRTRNINKPTTGTAIVAIGAVSQPSLLSVDTTTGIVTLDADIIGAITGVTQANPCVITDVAHGLATGDSTYISGVSGMTELNGNRYTVTKLTNDTYSIGVNSTGYGAYTSGGVTNTIPQTGEPVTAGFEFDVPCRFNTDTLSTVLDNYITESTVVPIVEIRI